MLRFFEARTLYLVSKQTPLHFRSKLGIEVAVLRLCLKVGAIFTK